MNNRTLLIAIGGFLVLAVILFGVMVACSPKQKPQNEKVVLNYWTVFDNEEKLQPIIEKYEKSHPNVDIQYKKLTYEEYQKTLNESFAGGKGPDIFSVQNSWMPKYFDKISPIPEKTYKTADYKKDFYPAISDTIKDDRIYAIPITMDALGLYVNDTLLSKSESGEAPKTWQDLVGDPDTKKPNTIPGMNNRQGNTFNQSAIALGNDKVPRAADILALMMLQQRTQMTNPEKTQATFNLTQTVNNKEVNLGTDALKFYTSFANPASENYSWNAQQGDAVTAFSRGKVVMMVAYGYQVPILDRLNPDMSYSVKPVPQIAGTEPVNYANYWGEAVAKNSKNQQQAWSFIRYLTDKDQMAQYAEDTRQMPARKDLSQSDDKLQDLQKQLETATTWYKGDAEKADSYFLRMISQTLAGENPQNAINRSANDLTEVYKQINAN
jgi:multiple sugar transport system substrate-binding protein